jgi:RNA polymerase sigma-70 factor (ECF subfamily)
MGVKSKPARLQTLDPAAWLDDHGDVLFSFALSKVRQEHAAEDLVQETLLAAMRQRDSFKGRSTVRTWLIAILKHKILDYRRTQTRRANQRSTDEAEWALDRWTQEQFTKTGKWRVAPARWADVPNDSAEQLELKQMLAKCMSKLPIRAAEALLLCERQSLSAEQIGKILNISATNVGVTLFRARTALRRCIEERWFAPATQSRP